jgi:hypothetical protein
MSTIASLKESNYGENSLSISSLIVEPLEVSQKPLLYKKK